MVSNTQDIGCYDQCLTKTTDATILSPVFCTLIAPSGGGKSFFIRDFLIHMNTICRRKDGSAERQPDSIVIVSLIKDPIHEQILKLFPNARRRQYFNASDKFPAELYADEFYQQLDKNENNVLILDDLMGLMAKDQRFTTHLVALATVYRRHCGVSVLCLIEFLCHFVCHFSFPAFCLYKAWCQVARMRKLVECSRQIPHVSLCSSRALVVMATLFNYRKICFAGKSMWRV